MNWQGRSDSGDEGTEKTIKETTPQLDTDKVGDEMPWVQAAKDGAVGGTVAFTPDKLDAAKMAFEGAVVGAGLPKLLSEADLKALKTASPEEITKFFDERSAAARESFAQLGQKVGLALTKPDESGENWIGKALKADPRVAVAFIESLPQYGDVGMAALKEIGPTAQYELASADSHNAQNVTALLDRVVRDARLT